MELTTCLKIYIKSIVNLDILMSKSESINLQPTIWNKHKPNQEDQSISFGSNPLER